MVRALAVLVFGLSLSAIAWKLHQQDRALEALRSRVTTLSSQDEQPADQKLVCPIVCPAPPPAPRADRAAAAPEALPPARPLESPPEPEPTSPEEQRANLAATFEAETADPSWSGPETKRWVSVLSDVGLSSTELAGVECRRSLCRAQLHLANDARYNAFLKTAVASPALRTAGVQSTFLREPASPDGRVPVWMYFSRAGTTLPLLD